MRIIFVGIHNKPGKKPLDSSTKSGILIDRCIRALRPKECIKTNLFDTDYLPSRKERNRLVVEWYNKVEPTFDDIVILLGNITHVAWQESCFVKRKLIMAGHPSGVWSNEKKDWYVKNIVKEVTRASQ